MNIFLTSDNPVECARALDDKRVIKMALETAQLICTAVDIMGGDTTGLYRTTHRNHPCAVWSRERRANMAWLIEHGIALCDEFTFRYGKIHSSKRVIINAGIRALPLIKPGDLSFTSAQPDAWTFNCSGFASGDVFRDYRLCLVDKWQNDTRPAVWTLREAPSWFSSKEV